MKKKRILSLAVLLMISGSMASCGESQNSSIPASSQQESVNPPSSSVEQNGKHYEGQGVPTNAFGNNGDTWTDTDTGKQYVRVNGEWVEIATSKSEHHEGIGAPSNDLGNNGDTYTDTDNGNEYTKKNGIWVLTHEGNISKHTVTFDLNGGMLADGSISIEPELVKNGEWAIEPPSPMKKNCTFLGWFSGDMKWNFTSPVYGDLNLIAKYSINEDEKVTLMVDPGNGAAVYSVDCMVGDHPRIETPTKDGGYSFAGWYFTDTNERYMGTITADMNGRTIRARFEKSQFDVLYQIEDDNTITITGLINIDAVTVDVPAVIDGYPVTTIGKKAFQYRQSLVTVNLPNSIKTIEGGAFSSTTYLQFVNVADDNPYFSSDNGILFNKNKTEIVVYPCKAGTSYTIPASVTKIAPYCFYLGTATGLSSINFNEGLVEIGERAFMGQVELATLTFPSTLKKIGDYAFCIYGEGNIQTVQFNDGLEEIGANAFVGAYFKDTFQLPSTVKKIGAYAFANCTAIKKFIFPAALEDYDPRAFNGCTGILSIELEAGNTHFAVNDNILYTADMKKEVMCPSGRTEEVIIPAGVEEIGDYGFYMVDQCQDYTFPDSLTKIGTDAFAQCYGLRTFTLPKNLTTLGDEAFMSCESLNLVDFNKKLTEIPEACFYGCTSLKSIEIPSTIKKIGKEAFSLDPIQVLTLNEGLEEIGDFAFYFNGQGTEDGFGAIQDAMTEVTLPNSVKKIGEGCFAQRNLLTTINFGTGLQEIGKDAFIGTGLTTITIPDANPYYSTENLILFNKDKTEVYFGINDNQTSLAIPEGVKIIHDGAFRQFKTVTSLTLPSTLEEIGENAFTYIHAKTLTVPASCKKIGKEAFTMGYIETLTLNEGLEIIGDSAFSSNSLTNNLTIPNSVTYIGEDAFAVNTGLKSLTMGTGVVTIGDGAFRGCRNIAGEVHFGAALKNLGLGIFRPLNSFANTISVTSFTIDSANPNFTVVDNMVLTKDQKEVCMYAGGNTATTLTLPETVTTIRDYGFACASKLTSVSLPASLTTIGNYAFSGDKAITSLTVPAQVSSIGKNAFESWISSQTITFSCNKDYTLKHFDQYFLGGCNATIVYGD